MAKRHGKFLFAGVLELSLLSSLVGVKVLIIVSLVVMVVDVSDGGPVTIVVVVVSEEIAKFKVHFIIESCDSELKSSTTTYQ